MKKNKVFLCIISACIIVVFTFLSTILWYKFFNRNTQEKLVVNQIYISNNDKQTISEIGIDDEYALNNNPAVYSFSVENTSDQELTYKLLIRDLSPSLITDGCKKENLLKREQLVYQVKLNGQVLIKDKMKNIENDILDIKNIKANTQNQYEISFWIQSGEKDYLNKHYHYEINLSV